MNLREFRRRRAVVLLHVVDKDDLVWITPIVQRAKVQAFVTAEGLALVEILSDGFESAETLPAFFNRGFQMLEDGKADVLLPLKLEAGGQIGAVEPKGELTPAASLRRARGAAAWKFSREGRAATPGGYLPFRWAPTGTT